MENPRILDEHIQVKEHESEYMDDLEALRKNRPIQRAIGRKDISDTTAAGDFCRRFTLRHLLQKNGVFVEIEAEVYKGRKGIKAWTIDVDAKVQEVFREKKEEAAKSYDEVYSLQRLYAFMHETEELIHSEISSGNTHPAANKTAFGGRLRRKILPGVQEIYLRCNSFFYNK